MQPTVFLLCGLPGTGKSTWAREREATGALRLCLDEDVLTRLADRRDKANDLRIAEVELRAMEATVAAEHRDLAAAALAAGQDVLYDNGFWFRKDRDVAKRLAEASGACWRLLYFTVDEATQWERLDARNRGDLTGAHYISRDEMEYFATRIEPPTDEGEERL